MNAELKGLRHEKEKAYGAVVMILGVSIWSIVAVALVAAVLVQHSFMEVAVLVGEILLFVLLITIINLFHRAYLFGHAVLISEHQLPHLFQSVERGAAKLGLEKVPQTFLYNSNGLMNAFAARMAGRSMVLITSAIVDIETPDQVDFIIAHELGHHAAGHLSPWKNALNLPGLFVPFLGPAYRRARELTADRIGAYCVDDVEAARGGLVMLACGSARLNTMINADAFAAQDEMVPPITGFLLHIVSGYPRLTRRVLEVETYFARARSPHRFPIGREHATA